MEFPRLERSKQKHHGKFQEVGSIMKPAEMETETKISVEGGVWTFSGINYTKQSSLTVTGTRRLLCCKIPSQLFIFH